MANLKKRSTYREQIEEMLLAAELSLPSTWRGYVSPVRPPTVHRYDHHGECLDCGREEKYIQSSIERQREPCALQIVR